MKNLLSLLCVSVLLLSACATTEVLNVWQEKDTQDIKFSNVLVIGVIKEPSYRRLFEDSMVDELNKLGVKASASYKLFPNVDFLDKSLIVMKIDQLKMDGVIVTKLIDKKKETVHTPGTTYVSGGSHYGRGGSWYGYYGNSYQVTHSPGYSVEYDISTVETNIYDAKSEDIVWAAVTETAETGVVRALKSYVEVIKKQLSSSNLF